MIIENSGLNGLTSELGFLDEVTTNIGFFRGAWDYTRATYDFKIEDAENTYYLRINTRAVEGKLENPHAILNVEHVYLGRWTFPHGVEYETPVPAHILKTAEQTLASLKASLN